MKSYKDILEKDQYKTKDELLKLKVGDKIKYKKNGKGQVKTGIISKLKGLTYAHIDNGSTAVDMFDILK